MSRQQETVMGTLGRVLVIVHGALSLAVLAWALGIYTHRINWNAPQGGGANKEDSVYARQKAKADEYNVAADRAYTRWSGNLLQVQALDRQRYPRRAFYGTQLYLVQTGQLNGKDVQNPVQQLVNAPDGYLDIRQMTGRPPYEVRAGVPADSIAGYERKMARLVEDIKASQVKNDQAIAEREVLNREIIGTQMAKGLRRRYNEQVEIMDRAQAEDQYAANFVTNREAEFGLFKKRRDALTDRMHELEKKK
jgi:hypothetical protein